MPIQLSTNSSIYLTLAEKHDGPGSFFRETLYPTTGPKLCLPCGDALGLTAEGSSSCTTKAKLNDLYCIGCWCVGLALTQVSVVEWRTMRAEGIVER